MKAWSVQARNPVEGGTVVRFAETCAKAKYAGLNELREVGEADEYADVSARRFKEMDGRENCPPTMKELVEEHGWSTMCRGCECKIDEEGAHAYDWNDNFTLLRAIWTDAETAECEVCAANGEQL